MKKFFLLSFLFSFFLFNSFQTKAANFKGGDLTYKCLGANYYLITLTTYWSCDNTVLPTAIPLNLRCLSDSSLNFSDYLLQVDSGVNITDNCTEISTACTGGNNLGYKEQVYQCSISFTPCNSWIMECSLCCRGISTNVVNNGTNFWYLKAFLNNLDAPCNYSPIFLNKPLLLTNSNQQTIFNNGVVDPHSDSIVYSFYSPFTINDSSTVNYASPYSNLNFLSSSTPVTLNSITGDIKFTPNTTQTTLVGLKVEEYRNIFSSHVLIGTVYRDIHLKVDQSNYYSPILSGIDFNNTHEYNPNNLVYSITTPFQQGKVISFDIAGFDTDTFNSSNNGSPEKFSISWNNGIPQASFQSFYNNTDSAYAHFNWNLYLSDASNNPKCFTAKIKDNSCPYNLSNTYSYCFTILFNPNDINESSKNLLSLSQNYPNPAKDYTLIDVELAKESKTSILITDICGRKVLEKDFGRLPNGKSTLEIPLGGIASGLYFYTLVFGNERISKKMVLE